MRIEFEYLTESRKPKVKIQPLNLLADAFSANVDSEEYAELWAKITTDSKNGSDPSPLSNIFADETIRFLSLVSNGGKGKEKEVKSPTFSLFPLSPPMSPVKRSFSAGDEPSTSTAVVELVHTKSATDPVSATPLSPLAIGSDWAQFSSSGFLDTSAAIVPLVSTLFDTDIEKTVPPDPPVPTLSRKSSRRAKGKSVVAIADSFASQVSSPGKAASIEGEESGPTVKATNLEIIQFDEAFIDFWSDSLLDPITSQWPTFIICKFKSTLVPKLTYGTAEEGKPQKTLKWLILEQVYTVKPPPPPPPAPAPVIAPPAVDPELIEAARPSSPTASVSGKKRFMFWSVSRSASTSSATSTSDKEKGRKTPKVSEMGEVIEEEGGKTPSSPTRGRMSLDFGRRSVDHKKKPADQGRKSLDQKPAVESSTAATAVVAAAAVVGTGAVLAAVPEDRPVEEEEKEERVESRKVALVTDPDVKVSALEMTPPSHIELRSEPVPTLATEVAAISSKPIPSEEIAKLEPLVSNPVASEAEVIAPVVEEEKVADVEAVKEAGIVPTAIVEEKVVEAEAVKEVEIVPAAVEEEKVEEAKEGVDEKPVPGEAMTDFEIVPAAVEEEKAGEAEETKEEVEEKVDEEEAVNDFEIVPAAIEEEKEEVGIVPAAIEEKVAEVEAVEEEVGIIPATIEEKAVELEATEEEVEIVPATIKEEVVEVEVTKEEDGIVPAAIEEKVVEVETKEEEVEIIPAAIEEEKVVEVEATEGEVEIVPAAIEEAVIEAEPPKESHVVVDEPVVSPSVPVVETEVPVLAKEEIAAAELVAPPVVEVEEVHLVETVALGEVVKEVEIGPALIEEENIVEVNATTEEVGITSATVEETLEPPKEDLTVVEPVASPSTPVVETEISVEPELAEEVIPATELVAHPIVEVEEVQVLEAVAPVVEQVESEPTQDEVTITEPIAQPPVLEAEVSPVVEEPVVLEQPILEETKPEDVETNAAAEPVTTIEEVEVHVLEAVAPVVEQNEVVEGEPTQDEVTITEPITQPPVLEAEVSPTVEEPAILEQPILEETKPEDVETNAAAEPVTTIEEVEVHVLEAVAPVVEQNEVVESEPTQDEVTITEPIDQPPVLEAEVSLVIEEPVVLEQPVLEETKPEDVETNAAAEPISTIEEVLIPVLATQELIETEAAEPLPVVQPIIQPSVPVIDTIPATELEALEQAKLDEISVDNEDMQVDTEAVLSVEEVVEPVSVPADSASEDIVIVEQEETTESAPPVSETLLPSREEEEAIPAPEHLQDVSAVPLADEDLKERDVSAIEANMEVDIEEEREEDISVEGFSVVPVAHHITSSEEWEEVIAVPESEPAAQVVQQQVEEVPVVPVTETIALDEEEGVLVPKAEPAVEVAEEAEDNVEAIETETASGLPTDDLVEAKKEDEVEQMKLEVAEEEVEEAMVKEAEPEHVDEIAAKEIKGNVDDVEKAKEVEVENVVEMKEEIVKEVEEAKEIEAEIVDVMVEETAKEVEDKSVEIEKEDTEDEVNKVEEMADEVEQELEGSVVASVVIPEADDEGSPKFDAVVAEEARVSEHDFVPQAPVEDKPTPASAQDEEVVVATEEAVSAMSAALESTGNVPGDILDIPPNHVEQIAPVPPMETTTSNDELLDAGSEPVLEIVGAKAEEPKEIIEETIATAPMVELVVEAVDEEVGGIVDEHVEGLAVKNEDEALPASNDPVETEMEVTIGELEDKVSEQAEAYVEAPSEVAKEDVEWEGEQVEEVFAAGASLEGLVEETTLLVDENATGFPLTTTAEPVEVSKEGEEPVAVIEEETVSAPLATLEEPILATSESLENMEDSAGIEEEVVIDRDLSEPALDVSLNEVVEEVTPEPTEGVEEKLEEPMTTIENENASRLTVPDSADAVGGEVEVVVGVEDGMTKPEDEASFDSASEHVEEQGGLPAVQAEEEAVAIPAVVSEVLLETSLEKSAALHEDTSISSSALAPEAPDETEAGLLEPVDWKEQEAIVGALVPELTEKTSVDPTMPVEENEIIPEQEPVTEEVGKADEVVMVLEEIAPISNLSVEAAERVEVIEENAGERSLVVEDEAEPSSMAISGVDLEAEALEEDSADGTQVVEDQVALHLEHTAEPPNEAVEEVVEAIEPDVEEVVETIEPDVEESVAHIETQEVVVTSDSEPLTGTGEDIEVVEEVAPSSEDRVVGQTTEEPITTVSEIEVAPISTSAPDNVGEKQAMQAEVVPSYLEAAMEQVVEFGQKEELVEEAPLEQHPATDQGVVEDVSINEIAPPSDAFVAHEGAVEKGLDMVAPTVEDTIGPLASSIEHLPGSEIPVESISENDAEEPNTTTEDVIAGETDQVLDHQVEEKSISVDGAEVNNIC